MISTKRRNQYALSLFVTLNSFTHTLLHYNLGVNLPNQEAYHSVPYSIEVNNEWINTSITPISTRVEHVVTLDPFRSGQWSFQEYIRPVLIKLIY